VFLVVGLGNPGEEYADTPHNLGFLVIDRLAGQHGIRVSRKEARSLTGVGEIGGHPVILAKPQTFMNLSGGAVKQLMEKHDVAPGRVIVVQDELDLPWASLRIKVRGSAAGHNGVQSVIGSLGTDEFIRVRLGIHPGRPVRDGAAFVLAPLHRSQSKELDELTGHAAEAVASIIADGAEKSMTKYNRRAGGSQEEQ
jgi:peptidyl-tRNA hydrolase, PTH1 family